MTVVRRRARLDVRLVGDRIRCDLSLPERTGDPSVVEHGFDAEDANVFSKYYDQLSLLVEAGEPSSEWLRSYENQRVEAAKRLLRLTIGQEGLRYIAQGANAGMALLEISASSANLDQLPWELIGDPGLLEEDRSLEVVVWRRLPVPTRRWQPRNCLLIADASPPRLPSPNSDVDFNAIQASLHMRPRHDVHIARCRHATFRGFLKALTQHRPGIVHLITHGGRGAIAFESGQGTEHPDRSHHDEISHDDIVANLAYHDSLTVVLSVCETGYSSRTHPSLIRRLAERGAPAAIGMARKITPVAGQELTGTLYRELFQGAPLADAFATAVTAIRRLSSFDRLLWSVPMLYANDNVTPFPTSKHLELIGHFDDSLRSIKCLRRSMRRISLLNGLDRHGWNVESTPVVMGFTKLRRHLNQITHHVPVTRSHAYAWKHEFDLILTALEGSCDELLRCLGNLARLETSTDGEPPRDVIERSVRQLNHIERLLLEEHPAGGPAVQVG